MFRMCSSAEQKVECWLPGAGGGEGEEWLLTDLGFLFVVMRMFWY